MFHPELASATFRKSSLSTDHGACVEVADLRDGRHAVRHSRYPNGEVLVFSPEEWDAFLGGVARGEFGKAH